MSQFQSSGNLGADRRYLWAEASEKQGDFAGAADLYAQAVESAPDWAAGWFALGKMLDATGQSTEAQAAFTRCLALAPGDALGAGVHLARLTGANSEMPAEYVAGLFDQYADRFDTHLTEALAYRGPAVVDAALRAIRPPPYGSVLDLGCGTGLMAAQLAGHCGPIDGIDLSPAMLRVAQTRGMYRTLLQADAAEGTARLAAQERYDMVLAADVLVYIGDLAPLLGAVHHALAADGLFAFTVQAFTVQDDGDAGYRIGQDMRFHHSEPYLRAAARNAGFTVRHLAPATTRQDKGEDVAGLVAIFSP